MKWTNDPTAFSKAVYEAGTAFFEAANSLLDTVSDGLQDLEDIFDGCFPLARSDDCAAASESPYDDVSATEDRAGVDKENQVRSMVSDIVRAYRDKGDNAMVSAWLEVLGDVEKIKGFAHDKNKYETLANHRNWLIHR